VHQPQRAGEAVVAQRHIQPAQIGCHQRLHVGVGAGGDEARVFADLGHHLGRGRHRDAGQFRGHDGGGLAFVARLPVGIQEADRHRPRAGAAQRAGGAAHRFVVQRGDHAAVAVDALGHFQPAPARHQRFGKRQEQIVDVVALLGAGFQHVGEAGGGDQAQHGALALDHRVGDERGAVDDLRHLGQRRAVVGDDAVQPLQRADRRVLRRGEAFVQPQRAGGRIGQHEIGEGATDIETKAQAGGRGNRRHDGELRFWTTGSGLNIAARVGAIRARPYDSA
jgi:hypothetical protein